MKMKKSKVCKCCAKRKKIEHFAKDAAMKDGFSFYCRQCNVFKRKAYREANYEKYRESERLRNVYNPEYHKKYYSKPEIKQKMKKYLKKYRLSNLEKFAKYQKDYYAKNLERNRKAALDYYYANRERILAQKKEQNKNKKK